MGLRPVLKTVGTIKGLGVGTSFFRMIETLFYLGLLIIAFIAAYSEGMKAIDDLFGE